MIKNIDLSMLKHKMPSQLSAEIIQDQAQDLCKCCMLENSRNLQYFIVYFAAD
jgi:hypothetical protein